MKTYEQIKDFNNWSNSEKDNFSISVIKGLVLDATRKANSGHPGGPMSCADFAIPFIDITKNLTLKIQNGLIEIVLYFQVDICLWFNMLCFYSQAG